MIRWLASVATVVYTWISTDSVDKVLGFLDDCSPLTAAMRLAAMFFGKEGL